MFWKKDKNRENTGDTDKGVSSEPAEKISRRDMLKLSAIGTAAGAMAAVQAPRKAAATAVDAGVKEAVIREHDQFPHEVKRDFQPHKQHDTVHGRSFFKLDKYWGDVGSKYVHDLNYHFDNSRPGYTQLDKALVGGAWALSNTGVGPSPGGVPDFGLFAWEQAADKAPHALFDLNFVKKEKYQFKSKEAAAGAIKRAARFYGAELAGITRRDKRWDYSQFFNPVAAMKGGDAFYGWEKFPFEPKTVIVLAFEMNYEAASASPTEVAAAAAGEGYSRMAKTAHQLAVFLKSLGYKAVPAGNDLGLSVPYAIAAGLGEGSRMGPLINYKYGPRIRLAKVYTDLEFVAYDKPMSFGVFDFCRRCRRCAEACPGKAITFDDKPSFAPTHSHRDNPWFNAVGVYKYYLNAPNCYSFWCSAGTDCMNCITSCPYNKPDFWHHRLVAKLNHLMPEALHTFMKQMDIVFGYGNTYDQKAVKRFWSKKDRSYNGL